MPATALLEHRTTSAGVAPLSAEHLSTIGVETPFLACDLSVVEQRLRDLRRNLPDVAVHFAVKCNPAPAVLDAIARAGGGFEIASLAELDLVEATGTPAAKVLYSNPVKPPRAVSEAYRRGVYRFAFDSEAEVRKLAALAPGASVYVRLAVDDSHSLFPLSRKFGAPLSDAHRLLVLARDLGLVPYGVTFHVGSQCTDPTAWSRAVRRCGVLLGLLESDGIRLEMLDIGGGFPVPYTEDVPGLDLIGQGIRTALDRLPHAPRCVVAEPGRYLVAESCVLVSTVIGLAVRDDTTWAYLDVGGYNGLMEAVQTGGRWRFPLRTDRPDETTAGRRQFTVTGPSCDSSDTLFYDALLPSTLEVGDQVHIAVAGAYSLSYASNFNGFPPPELLTVEGR